MAFLVIKFEDFFPAYFQNLYHSFIIVETIIIITYTQNSMSYTEYIQYIFQYFIIFSLEYITY